MPEARDPRVDPRPGDLLAFGEETYEVVSIEWDEFLQRDTVACRVTRTVRIPFYAWKLDRKNARVIARGGE